MRNSKGGDQVKVVRDRSRSPDSWLRVLDRSLLRMWVAEQLHDECSQLLLETAAVSGLCKGQLWVKHLSSAALLRDGQGYTSVHGCRGMVMTYLEDKPSWGEDLSCLQLPVLHSLAELEQTFAMQT